MYKSTVMGISLFLLLKLMPGFDSTEKNSPVKYHENGTAEFAGLLGISVQPVDQTDCKGNKVTFSVVTNGGVGTIHYQWQRKRPGDAGFASFGAVDSTKLPVYNIGVGNEAPDGTIYQVVVTDQASVVMSGPASLKVNQITGIAPIGVATYTKNQGDDLWFKVLTTGNSPLAYQWIKKQGPNNWTDLTDNSIIAGSRAEQLNFNKISVADSGIYKVRVIFPTINGSQCTETSSITRTVHIIPDTEPPVFINLGNKDTTLCPEVLEQAVWVDSLSDIMPVRTRFYKLNKSNSAFDLSNIHFSDNVTPTAELVLHWGIYSALFPFAPITDETGTPLDDRIGQISQHPENINFETPESGSQTCQIIFWLEDGAGNLTPASERYKLTVMIPPRPEILSNF
jgi:hypothetical protein